MTLRQLPQQILRLTLFALLCVPNLAHAATHTATLSPGDGNRGFEGNFTFSSGFRNCYGEVSVGFGNPQLTPTRYHYRGASYSPADLGLESFSSKRPGAEIEADVYDGQEKLGHVTFTTVTFFSAAGCFTETYKVIRMLGLKDADYRKKVEQLSLQNLSVKARVTDYKLEQLIDQRLAEEKKAKEQARKEAAAQKTPDEKRTTPAAGVPVAGAPLPTPESSPKKDSQVKSTSQEKSASNSGPTDAEIRAQQVQLEKNRIARETIEQTQTAVAQDQARVQGYGDAANSVFGAAIAAGLNVGLGFIMTDHEPMDAASNNNLFTFMIGKSKNPTTHRDSKDWSSGTVFTFAVNIDALSPDPIPKSVSLGSENSKRWVAMAEIKKFGNLSSMNELQPFLGVGLAQCKEYTPTLNPISSKITPTVSIGLAVAKNDGWFTLGWNLSMNAFDIGVGF